MCSHQQHYDCSRVKLAQTDKSGKDSVFPPVCTRLLRAPSLNSILQGNVAPRDNVEELEQNIWLAESPETFLQASLQFLENKLHNRIYTAKPSPSGKVVLSEGFIFTPIYPTDSLLESQSGRGDEHGTKVHGRYQEKTRAKRVDSVTYSCVSIPSEHGKNRSPYRNGSEAPDVWPKSLRNVGVQTSFELLTGRSSLVSDEETKPIHTFSEYVEYCQAHVRTPSQLFSFGGSSQMSNNLKTSDINQDINSPIGYTAQSTDNDMEDVLTSARTYVSHHRSSMTLTSSPTEDVYSSGHGKSAVYDDMRERRQLLGQNSTATESNTTMSSAKSIRSNKTDPSANGRSSIHPTSSSASTKSVYYYARISASFFAFLTRATQKNKTKKKAGRSSIVSKTSSKTTSNGSSQDRKFDRAVSSIEDDGESKLTFAKLNVLRRFMNFLGGAKSSKEYEKVNGHSAAVVDVSTGLLDDEHVFNCEATHNATKHNENRIKCSSFSVSENHRKEPLPGRAASAVSSEKTVVRKESNLFIRPIRKLQPKPKAIRQTQRVHLKDTDQNISRTTVQDFTQQQQTIESHCPDVFKGKPPVVSPVDSKTLYSKSVCNEILKLRFEGDAVPPVRAAGTTTDDGILESESVIVTVTDTTSSDEKLEGDSTLVTATETTSNEGNECCFCYKPPTFSSANGVLPHKFEQWHRDQHNQTVMCATNQYICYARAPENQIMNESYHHQQNIQTEQPKKRISIESLLKSHSNKGQNTCDGSSTVSQTPTTTTTTTTHGRLILKPKPPILKHNTDYFPKLQTNETQESDPQSSSYVSICSDGSKFLKPKKNSPLIRKQNTYLIEKPQVYPDRITRLLPQDKHKLGLWAFPSVDPKYYQDSTVGYSTTTNQARSSDENNSLNCLSNICEDSSVCTIPDTFSKNVHGIPSCKHNYTPKVNYTMNTASSSSSDFDATTSCINNTQSNSSRSSYWLPPKRLARGSRTFPKWNPSNTTKIKQSFSKEVIKLFQRVPKPFRK